MKERRPFRPPGARKAGRQTGPRPPAMRTVRSRGVQRPANCRAPSYLLFGLFPLIVDGGQAGGRTKWPAGASGARHGRGSATNWTIEFSDRLGVGSSSTSSRIVSIFVSRSRGPESSRRRRAQLPAGRPDKMAATRGAHLHNSPGRANSRPRPRRARQNMPAGGRKNLPPSDGLQFAARPACEPPPKLIALLKSLAGQARGATRLRADEPVGPVGPVGLVGPPGQSPVSVRYDARQLECRRPPERNFVALR